MTNALHAQLLLERRQLAAARFGTTHALIRLEAEGRPDLQRPPLDLVACIDVSGSMSGRKLDEVKRSLLALGAELGAQDRLGVTSFETEVAQVLPPTRMDDAGKARLRAAVRALETGGSTGMSGGLLGAIADLEAAPPPPAEAVRRVLLFTDGHANHGIPESDRSAWSALLRERLEGFSVSWFGFGEDHDADFLAFLADQTRGNAYVAKDADAIADAFAKELGGLMGLRATDIALEVRLSRGTATLLNDERSSTRGETLVISLDDLACEEKKDLVLQLAVPPLPEGEGLEVRVLAKWRDVLSGLPQETVLETRAVATAGPLEPPNEVVQEAVALVFAANAQKRAWAFAEQGRWVDAGAVMKEAIEGLARLATPRAQALARQLAEFATDYADRVRYLGNRSRLKANERAMSKQRTSGSAVDEVFSTDLKRGLGKRFKA